MPISRTKPRLWLATTCVATLLLSACGGAQERKAHHLEKGQSYLLAGNYEKARVEFRNALQIVPTDSQARYENGVADEKLGNPREAAQFYQGAIDSNKDNVDARASLGRLYLLSGAPEKALEIINPSFTAHPDDARLLTVRAAARIQMKDSNGALQDARRAVELAPNSEDAVAVLAGIYKSQGQNDKAEAALLGAIKLIPNSVDLRLALAQLYSSAGHDSQVETILVDLVHQKPDEKAHRFRLAQYYARLNRNDEAEKSLRESIKAIPKDRDLKIALVDFLATRRDRGSAEKELVAMIASDEKDDELKFYLGQFYQQGKEFPKAETVYKQVITSAGLEGAGITARNRLAAMRIQQSDLPSAEKLIDEVLAKSPRDNDALVMRGNMALVKNDPKTAIADLRSVLRDQPNSVAIMRSLARAHLLNGEPALAEETMRRAVDADPKDPAARLDLAQLLIQMGKPAQAGPVVSELVKQQPNNIQALDAQFKTAVASNDLVVAKSAADAMVALQPTTGMGYHYQGAVAEAENHPEDALHLYSKALELQPESYEPLEGLTRILVHTKRVREALQRLDEVIARYPKIPLASNRKGEVLLSQERAVDAIDAFKEAITREPKWWTPYRNLAVAENINHNSEAAVAALQSGIGKVAKPEVLETTLADQYERTGKIDAAIAVYQAGVHRDPQSEVLANNLAMMLVSYKKDAASLNQALRLSERFSTSTNLSYLDTYGWVLYKRGDAVHAVSTLQAVLSKSPESSLLLYHLGMAQSLAGQADAARDSLTRALKSGTNFVGKEEARSTLDKLAKLGSSAVAPKS